MQTTECDIVVQTTECDIVVQALLDHDADVNAVDIDGNTALHLICSDRDNYHLIPDAVTLLVRDETWEPLNWGPGALKFGKHVLDWNKKVT